MRCIVSHGRAPAGKGDKDVSDCVHTAELRPADFGKVYFGRKDICPTNPLRLSKEAYLSLAVCEECSLSSAPSV